MCDQLIEDVNEMTAKHNSISFEMQMRTRNLNVRSKCTLNYHFKICCVWKLIEQCFYLIMCPSSCLYKFRLYLVGRNSGRKEKIKEKKWKENEKVVIW